MFGAAPVNDSHFNEDYLLNFNHYADFDGNPYVVGSTAYNIAHGLPQPSPWEEEEPSGSPQGQSAGETMTTSTTAATGNQPIAAAPAGLDLSSLLVPAAIIAVLWAISQ